MTQGSEDDHRAEVVELMTDLGEAAAATLGPADRVRVEGVVVEPAVVEAMLAHFQRLRDARLEAHRPETLSHRQQAKVVYRRYLDAMREALQDERALGAYSTAALTRAQALSDAEELRQER